MNKEENKEKESISNIGKIEPRAITDEIEECYLDYAMSVIISRALPDVRDGLKPVHRRILYAMHDLGLKPSAKFRKSATVVGEVLGKYHPHGDVAVYDSMVRLAQDFSLRYPLVNGQGNFGSMDGDSAAAMRYTEAKLKPIAEEMLSDIEKKTVDFADNYDKSRQEPVVLPSKLPQLLLNGTMGIAVGMATNILPHNLNEVIDATVCLIDNSEATVEDLLEFIQGPDFPTGGSIFDAQEISQVYFTGKGRIVARAKADIIETKKEHFQIIVSEMVYQVNKSVLIEKIADLVKTKKIEGIKDIRDESNKEGVRIVIDLKNDAYPNKILNRLYQLTDLQKPFHANMLAIVDGIQPKVLNLKMMLEYYLKHRQEVVRRRTQFELDKAKERAHILEGLSKALDHIDEVIKTIKQSKTKEIAHQQLMKKFKLSDRQTTAILEMKLQTLAGLERQKIKDELEEKLKLIAKLEAILKNPKKILQIIKDELLEIKNKYGDERRTKVYKNPIGKFAQEDLIPKEEVVISITHGGYIKRIDSSTYHVQHRGGKGVIGAAVKEEDAVEHFLSCDTLSDLLFFTNNGRVFQTKAYEIPASKRTSKGQAVVNFLQLAPNESITAVIPLKKENKESKKYLVMATKNGIIKKTSIEDFASVRRSGLIALKIKKNDELKWVKASSGKDEVMLTASNGQAIRFKEKDIRPMGRTAAGVKAIRLSAGSEVVSMDIVEAISAAKKFLLVLSENGFGKQSEVKFFKVQRRGGSGIKAAKTTGKTGAIVSARIISENQQEEDLFVASQKGQVIRIPIKSIPTLGRATQGVRIMRLAAGDKVALITSV
jgi:DNA gyrase subunit A